VVVVDAIICNIKILFDVINLSTLSSHCRASWGGGGGAHRASFVACSLAAGLLVVG